jgi:hypothetical protein
MLLSESKLADLVIDLFDQYGGSNAKPFGNGMMVGFTVVANRTEYHKARKEIEALLTLHGLTTLDLCITPGPEVPQKTNRCIKFSLAKSQVM